MRATKLSAIAPAKLNLRLKVVGRRADGFHELSMLNATINLCDQLEISKQGSEVILSVDSADLLQDLGPLESNLACRAARLFLEHYGINDAGVSISLKKVIPVGAGLGGGSSDAAATLLLMARLFEAECAGRANFRDLMILGASLGADVPYFIQGGLCVVEGIGDSVQAIKDSPLKGSSFLLICPPEHSSTIEVYRSFTQRFPSSSLQPDSKLKKRDFSYQNVLDLVENDLAAVVFERSPECKKIFELISDCSEVVSGLTGSGSALFCLPRQQNDVNVLKKVQESLPNRQLATILTFY